MIRIAIPNKGRLADAALELLERAGYPAAARSERALQADLSADVQAIFARSRDIPEFVADGVADLGLTGRDLLVEAERDLVEVLDLGFGRCRLVVAARESTADDDGDLLAPGAGRPPLRVATSFPRAAERWFAERGVPAVIVPLSGAVEVAPHVGVADVIVDLVSTGSTLRTNGLRELATILDSTAVLIARREGIGERAADGAGDAAARELVAALESVVRARDKRYLMANVRRDSLAEVKRILPGISGPTIVEVLDGGAHVAAHAVVGLAELSRVIAELKGIGAEGILVTRIERLMP